MIPNANIDALLNAPPRKLFRYPRIPPEFLSGSSKFGLIPGTSKYFAKNDRNTFYQSRVNAAFLLYKMQKIKKIIVSGTSEKFYDEPKQLRADLKKMGIPDSAIVSDATGSDISIDCNNPSSGKYRL